MTDLIQTIARAVYEDRFGSEMPPKGEGTGVSRAMALRNAQAALTAINAAGYAIVPREPTEAMWGGLARDIVMWMDFERKTPAALFKHLERIGREIPDWLHDEGELTRPDHVPSKGTRAVLIYRAMLDAAITTGERNG